MSRVGTYLNFMGQTEEAFTYYATLFGTEITSLTRFGDIPDGPPLADDEKNLVMNAAMTIVNGHQIMATDMLPSMGHSLRIGNNTTVLLDVDSRDEADRYFNGLSDGGSESQGMADMFWGAYWGVTLDRFGIRWMINHTPSA